MSDASRIEVLAEGLGIPLVNDRDQAGLGWLLEQIGESGIREAVAGLSGQRRPFVSNLAKAAGLQIPAAVHRAGVRAEGVAALQGIRGILTEAKGPTGDRMGRYRGR